VTLGADNFGDIMGGCETHVMLGGSFTPMERVVLTANGNLQRIMSAYYGYGLPPEEVLGGERSAGQGDSIDLRLGSV
jgi:hypothetical protein